MVPYTMVETLNQCTLELLGIMKIGDVYSKALVRGNMSGAFTTACVAYHYKSHIPLNCHASDVILMILDVIQAGKLKEFCS